MIAVGRRANARVFAATDATEGGQYFLPEVVRGDPDCGWRECRPESMLPHLRRKIEKVEPMRFLTGTAHDSATRRRRSRRLDAPALLAEVAEGVTYVNGVRVKPSQPTADEKAAA